MLYTYRVTIVKTMYFDVEARDKNQAVFIAKQDAANNLKADEVEDLEVTDVVKDRR